MSSVTQSSTSTPQHSETHTAKKKFGKNLNKLTKAPAPPINSGAPKSNGSSRNGLLLLSTKRNTSAASGILAQKAASSPSHKPLPSLGLQYESKSSTHDALLGAVVGASRAEAQHQPDAWGVAQQEKASSPVEDSNRREEQRVDAPTSGQEAPSWDDYGDRQSQGEAAHDTQETKEQGVRMSKLAKERAEKRRSEEEARFASQKERASQRLKELEEKMRVDSVETKPPQEPQKSVFAEGAAQTTPVGFCAWDCRQTECSNANKSKDQSLLRPRRLQLAAPTTSDDPSSSLLTTQTTQKK